MTTRILSFSLMLKSNMTLRTCTATDVHVCTNSILHGLSRVSPREHGRFVFHLSSVDASATGDMCEQSVLENRIPVHNTVHLEIWSSSSCFSCRIRLLMHASTVVNMHCFAFFASSSVPLRFCECKSLLCIPHLRRSAENGAVLAQISRSNQYAPY